MKCLPGNSCTTRYSVSVGEVPGRTASRRRRLMSSRGCRPLARMAGWGRRRCSDGNEIRADGESCLGSGKGFAEDQVDQERSLMVDPVPGNIGCDQGWAGAFCQVEYADQKIFCQVQVFRPQGRMIDVH